MEDEPEYKYRVRGRFPEDDENEEFEWTTGDTQDSLEEAQKEAQRMSTYVATGFSEPGEVWIERRSLPKWEVVK